MSGNRILIDTSAWINFFRDKTPPFSQKVDEFLSRNDIYVPKIVVAELIQGSKSEREVMAVKEFLEAFHIVDQKEDTWIKAGELSYRLKRKGKKVNLADCYIAVIAEEYGCQIFTLDEHFRDIKTAIEIKLVDVPECEN
jgi:predicted nucleic acid-binding protein